jgi:sulfite reductase alpha subunit-like flavoprotein
LVECSLIVEIYCGEEDKAKLLQLVSVAGRDSYIKYVTGYDVVDYFNTFVVHRFLNSHPSLLDILTTSSLQLHSFVDIYLYILQRYPTCKPPIAHILELLPPLTARDYSISSSPLVDQSIVSLVFSVIDFQLENSNKKVQGICTNWLEKQILRRFPVLRSDQLEERMLQLQLGENDLRIPIFYKASTFRLPQEISAPIVLVAAGTGIAPFLGFLEHRHIEKQSHNVGEVSNKD